MPSSENSFPTGCALSVFIYKQSSQVYSDSITTCAGNFTSSYMDSTMDKFDTYWEIWSGPVASQNTTSFARHSYTDLYANDCPTSAPSGFRAETEGGLNYNGVDYFAEAYDKTDGYVACVAGHATPDAASAGHHEMLLILHSTTCSRHIGDAAREALGRAWPDYHDA